MARIGVIGALILILIIPVSMVRSLIEERMSRYQEVVSEITEKWGASQTITGPVIVVPYSKITERTKDGIKTETRYAYFLPDDLKMKADFTEQTRKRSIFEAVLYEADIELSGKLPAVQAGMFPSDAYKVFWSEAVIVIGISDPRGIGEGTSLRLSGVNYGIKPGTGSNPFLQFGVHAPLRIDGAKGLNSRTFEANLKLKGSSEFFLTPVGRSTTATVKSSWSSPGFQGTTLPVSHSIDSSGFEAQWDVSYYGRNYGQTLFAGNGEYNPMSGSNIGFELILPVDHYQKSERAVKYAILFLVLTFAGFFLFEVASKLQLHPLQYLLVGSAMILFYLLFLSMSEHAGFLPAYLISSIAVIGLVASYCVAVLRSRKRGLIIGGLLGGLYTYLLVVLTSEDTALLLGSLILFALLATVMYFTRHIDWYTVWNHTQDESVTKV